MADKGDAREGVEEEEEDAMEVEDEPKRATGDGLVAVVVVVGVHV